MRTFLQPTYLEGLDRRTPSNLNPSHPLRIQLFIRPLDKPQRRRQPNNEEHYDAETHLPHLLDSDQLTVSILHDFKQ